MSLPPDDENPEELKGLFTDLSKELENAGFIDHSIRDELLSGIQDSLRSLFGEIEHEPQVTVVDGGRTHETPPSDKKKPDLRVAHFEESQSIEEQKKDFSYDSSNVSVRVIRPTELFSSLKSPAEESDTVRPGRISLASADAKQTIYIGSSDRTYRVHLHEGKVAIFVNSTQIATMSSEQSLDIEGAEIVLCSLGAISKGEYQMIETDR